MAAKRGNLYLYLTLICFFGIIAIFIIDGYMGIYETVYITTGEREQKIESDVWQRNDPYWSSGITRNEKAFIRYEVDNRRFSSYEADIDVSVWRMQEKIRDVLSQHIVVEAFNKSRVQWEIDTAELLPPDAPPEQGFDYTLTIKRGETERNIILYINPSPYPVKPVPAPR
jgi:phage terminase large subunit-like protein